MIPKIIEILKNNSEEELEALVNNEYNSPVTIARKLDLDMNYYNDFIECLQLGLNDLPGIIRVLEDDRKTILGWRLAKLLREKSVAELFEITRYDVEEYEYLNHRCLSSLKDILKYARNRIPEIIEVLEYPHGWMYVPVLKDWDDQYDACIYYMNFQNPCYSDIWQMGEFEKVSNAELLGGLRAFVNVPIKNELCLSSLRIMHIYPPIREKLYGV